MTKRRRPNTNVSRLLASQYDGGSIRLIENLGIAPGWHCLEVGAGHGGMARWLAATVGDQGRVMATDIDTRFLVDMPTNVIVREARHRR